MFHDSLSPKPTSQRGWLLTTQLSLRPWLASRGPGCCVCMIVALCWPHKCWSLWTLSHSKPLTHSQLPQNLLAKDVAVEGPCVLSKWWDSVLNVEKGQSYWSTLKYFCLKHKPSIVLCFLMFHVITLYDLKFDILGGVNRGLGLVWWCVKVWVSICLSVFSLF